MLANDFKVKHTPYCELAKQTFPRTGDTIYGLISSEYKLKKKANWLIFC